MPQRSAWLLLAMIAVPFLTLGIIDLYLNPSEWVTALIIIVGAVSLIAFNASMRLCISEENVRLKRYGRTVWMTPRIGTEVQEGFGGEIPIIPAFVLWHRDEKAGYLLKGWFDADAIMELRRALQAYPKGLASLP